MYLSFCNSLENGNPVFSVRYVQPRFPPEFIPYLNTRRNDSITYHIFLVDYFIVLRKNQLNE
jgi:hypothetical protein